ncbi:phage tail tape measure protein [Pseudoalteromonas obscura]|uniref:Phage tail tape measure protein n=1 Tax=Pseudoalteromonas obscura TaxID=3048491 RepID=A0ABT7ESB0_9GAMM|nr:phage tail tape measure protein [Pseudoalteromonas sp. P94(2023)]MDK2597898.1 phage tail tape measure protein [Pseudoalteromonas sp. P94(2023)]
MLPKPLMFTIGLIDQITKPVAHIGQQLNVLTADYEAGTMKMATGVAGIAASGFALYEALEPALEIDKALGQAKGVGLTDSALQAVTDTAMDFALQYGKSAVDVIGHAQQMRRVLGETSEGAIASITQSSATLAMVMTTDADTTARYFKNIVGNYGELASAQGYDQFIARIAGMTAFAKTEFGAQMDDIEGMIDGMHSLPATLGVPLEEQFAVLTMLNQQMGQGDAVTQYTNYLENIVAAQDKLGVKLTDSHGQMLPMVDVLNTLKPMLDGLSGDQAWKLLDDAGLGDGSLLIINAIKQLDQLKGRIDGFKNVDGLDPATQAAMDMTVQSERLAQSWFVVRAAFGAALLPAFNDLMGMLADAGQSMIGFTEQYPTLTRWLGYAALGVTGLVMVGGLLNVVMGASAMAMTAWSMGAMVWGGATAGLSATLATLRSVMLAVNIAMYANPIGLIVLGVTAAVAAVGGLIYYWDDLKATMSEWGWVQALSGIFAATWEGVKTVFTSTLDWIIDKLNLIPGVDIDVTRASPALPSVKAVEPVKSTVTPGGITQQIAQANNQKSTHVGAVNVYPQKGDTSYLNFVEMHA